MFDVFRKPLKILRRSLGTYINGCWREGSVMDIIIHASIRPTAAEAIELLSEGYRNSSSLTLITDYKLCTAKEGETEPDIVIIDEEKYIVVQVIPWTNLEQTRHYEIIIVKINIDEN